jgi:ATP-dependent helicase HrpB
VNSGLPIDAALAPLRAALRTHSSAVLEAPPGAGKSTVVPLALLNEPWAQGKRLLMLEPRRLATRAVAARMAQTLGEPPGLTIGYRMRLETRISRATRVEVLTEGVLTRLLQEDPALEGVAAVIFDEFHERSLQADLGLALCLDARAALATELRILVMSATLDGAAVARLLGDAPRISSASRAFEVETRYAGQALPLLPPAPGAHAAHSAEKLIAQLTLRALREEPGDVLLFLPGAREIRRVQSMLEAAALTAVTVLPLYGELPGPSQDAALAPAAAGQRKVVLATNIAETSLTIPGVRVVVDSGLMRRARFDPVTGMSRLETLRISRASAAQRQGRAGRTARGVCYRAWSEGAHGSLAAATAAEIVDADLAPLALELARWGVRDPHQLRWLDEPPSAMLASARSLLQRLGALSEQGGITAEGRAMARLGVHPRLAHMLLRSRALEAVPLAAQLAALLSERDLLRGAGAGRDADIRTRLELVSGEERAPSEVRAVLERVRRSARELERSVARLGSAGSQGSKGSEGASADAGLLLAFAYPDRIGRRRTGQEGRYTLANGRGAVFAEAQPLARQELIVAVELDDRERDARILLAAPLERPRVLEQFADAAAWPGMSDEALLGALDSWLAPWLEGITRREHLAGLPLAEALRARLSFSQQSQLTEWAPTHLTLPSGTRVRIDYLDESAPLVSVRLQEVFGMAETPRLGRQRVPVTFRLLSPAQRPVQVTRDLQSFWRGAYAQVRKDMRGRYPKHHWPENPLEAQPTRGTARARPR